MPDTETHKTVGNHAAFWGSSGVAGYHFLTPDKLPLLEGLSVVDIPLFALTVWIGNRLGSHLPDLIEPPKTPNHRGVAHSVTVYFLILLKVLWLWLGATLGTPGGSPWVYLKIFLFFFGLSYLSHLHMDAHTDQSIPWL